MEWIAISYRENKWLGTKSDIINVMVSRYGTKGTGWPGFSEGNISKILVKTFYTLYDEDFTVGDPAGAAQRAIEIVQRKLNERKSQR